ncbi:MAG: iron-sulfur cluster assembly accessory protein [Gammaproteobacteria bacterium]|nr:iron-sulfur cluster assembly accessory protein [Gammaproteobacteria bacterium]MBU1647236.1 iron-sulfur cluster assembly accessory protein [Gammaproteobacteria bacterium]MBU1972748.1 iron-sulfur cluster assembly accessory protein [Gammaproteobacteria bacterium]
MFKITETAAEQIRRAAESQPGDEAETLGLRIAAKIDDDGELAYGMGFDEERENDVKVESSGVTVLIAPHSQDLLAGAMLDFVELKPGEFQFVFFNPNEPAPPPATGCGSSNRGGGCGSGGCGSSGGGCG